MTDPNKVYLATETHITRFWSNYSANQFHPEIGPTHEILPKFSIYLLKPLEIRKPFIYVTSGAWEVQKERGFGLEFFVLTKQDDPTQIDNLQMIAYLHADPRYSLSLGRIVKIGRPWAIGSKLDRFLVTLPYPYGPNLEVCAIDNFEVYYLWLIPITESEEEYARVSGVESLERLFEDKGIDFLDPHRPPAI